MSLKRYLKSVEEVLTQYTLITMGRDPKSIIQANTTDRPLTVEELDDKPLKQKEYRSLWGDWVGREEDFYKETYTIIQAITPEDFDRITGIAQAVMLEDLKVKLEVLSTNEPPVILKRNPALQVKKIDENACVLIGSSAQEPVEVSRRMYDILEYFDGALSNKDVIQLLREKDMAEPTDELLLSLYRLRILVDGEEEL